MIYRCNLVVPGFPKSGTSSLHVYLDRHPEISMSTPKEPHFFNRDNVNLANPEEHNKFFSCSENTKFYGESSTTYCISTLACERIKQHIFEPKIIILLRDPVERAVSHYKWLCALGYEKRPLHEALMANGHGFKFGESWGGNYKSYIQFSEYSKYVPMWQESFGYENVLLLSTKELSASPDQALKKVWRFLGVESINVEGLVQENRTSEIKSKRLPRWVLFFRDLAPMFLRRRLAESKNLSKWLKQLLSKDASSEPWYTSKDIDSLKSSLERDISFYKKTFLTNE
ncbi:sulfotransferase [Alcanivorax sp. 521-1]|uniref:Sulfotransferase n=1 Tax=Alloalcanivorax profundimaris TaxID=2735259 RepID=A0ABS0AR08_9GAMM|nr:sulfotransferase domain-containing protein [Alloalcanivorax profundimaris]MBF5056077.1 sulfotransferase [Alloalcanivorax profundimaris]